MLSFGGGYSVRSELDSPGTPNCVVVSLAYSSAVSSAHGSLARLPLHSGKMDLDPTLSLTFPVRWEPVISHTRISSSSSISAGLVHRRAAPARPRCVRVAPLP